jgi:hypothetical protein
VVTPWGTEATADGKGEALGETASAGAVDGEDDGVVADVAQVGGVGNVGVPDGESVESEVEIGQAGKAAESPPAAPPQTSWREGGGE